MKKTSSHLPKSPAQREYIAEATKVAAHPVRSAILETLRGELPLTSRELVEKLEDRGSPEAIRELPYEELKQKRYNLYHHLELLENLDLIRSERIDGKTKVYRVNRPSHPLATVVILSERQINENLEEFFRFREVLEEIEGERVPTPEKIKRVEITFHYE